MSSSTAEAHATPTESNPRAPATPRDALATLTRPHPTVWVITVTVGEDNRMTGDAMDEVSRHLDTAESEWRAAGGGKTGSKIGGALVLTSGNPKFFCNGLGLPEQNVEGFMLNQWEPLKYRLLTYPLLTIAAINGHAFGGGCLVAMTCDLRLMTSGKGMLSINEVLIGVILSRNDMELLKAKITPPHGRPWPMRDVVLGKRFTQAEALDIGLIDEIVDDGGDRARLVARAVERGAVEGQVVSGGACGLLKEGIFQHLQEKGQFPRPRNNPGLMEAKWRTRMKYAKL